MLSLIILRDVLQDGGLHKMQDLGNFILKWENLKYFAKNRTYADCVQKRYIPPKKVAISVINPLNPPYQGDLQRKCVSPEKLRGEGWKPDGISASGFFGF